MHSEKDYIEYFEKKSTYIEHIFFIEWCMSDMNYAPEDYEIMFGWFIYKYINDELSLFDITDIKKICEIFSEKKDKSIVEFVIDLCKEKENYEVIKTISNCLFGKIDGNAISNGYIHDYSDNMFKFLFDHGYNPTKKRFIYPQNNEKFIAKQIEKYEEYLQNKFVYSVIFMRFISNVQRKLRIKYWNPKDGVLMIKASKEFEK